jgi:hypothetical protein
MIRNEIVDRAPDEYHELVEIVQDELRRAAGEKYKTQQILDRLNEVIPKKSEADYSYFMKCTIDTMFNVPFEYLKVTLGFLPEIMSDLPRFKSYRKHGSLISKIGYPMYRNLVYRPFEKTVVLLLLVIFTVFLPIRMYRRSNDEGLIVTGLLLIIWFHVIMLLFLAASHFYRLRLPIEPLIILTLALGIWEILVICRSKFKRDNATESGEVK